MTNPENNISSQTARQILLDAEKKGVSVEIYLKDLSEARVENCYKINVKKTTINYDFAGSRSWLKHNAQKYAGKWVVLDGKTLVGAGENPIPLVEKARSEGVEIPFVRFINDNSKPFMGG